MFTIIKNILIITISSLSMESTFLTLVTHARVYRPYTPFIVRINSLIGKRRNYPDPPKHFFW